MADRNQETSYQNLPEGSRNLATRRSLLAGAYSTGAIVLVPASLNAKTTVNQYGVLKSKVLNRGHPPDAFLGELIAWGKSAPDEIFLPNNNHDVYCTVENALGPWRDNRYRRAAMLEVMRVLAGFETSWNWNADVDTSRKGSIPPITIEAGAWQVSADSMHFGGDLKSLIHDRVGSSDPSAFRSAMKSNHLLAMEYIARLLRHTVNANGPVKREEINRWLSKQAAEKFLELIS